MDEELIDEICMTIEQFNKENNVKINLLLSPTLKYKIIGLYGIKSEIEPLMQNLINYISSFNENIQKNTVIFESQNNPHKKEIIYLFNIK